MEKSFKKTVQETWERNLLKRNSLIEEKIKKIDKYKASINVLSPIVSRVVNRRHYNTMKRQYSIMLKSRTRAMRNL